MVQSDAKTITERTNREDLKKRNINTTKGFETTIAHLIS